MTIVCITCKVEQPWMEFQHQGKPAKIQPGEWDLNDECRGCRRRETNHRAYGKRKAMRAGCCSGRKI